MLNREITFNLSNQKSQMYTNISYISVFNLSLELIKLLKVVNILILNLKKRSMYNLFLFL